jgi:hypothetical protein
VLRSVRVVATYEKVGLTPRYLRALHMGIFEQSLNRESGMVGKLINKNVLYFFIFIITILFLSTIAGCATAPRYPAVPFAVHRAGATISQDVKLVHDRTYELYLRYYHKGGEDSKRVVKLTGSGAYRRDESGKLIPVNDGVPVYLELKIRGLNEAAKEFYFEEKLFVGFVVAGGIEWVDGKPNKDTDKAYIDRIIKEIRLKPGLYRITLKSLRDITVLEGTSIAFKFSWQRNSVPFDQ